MASLDIIRTITIKAKSEGVDETAGSVRKLGDESVTMARKQLSVEKQMQSLERRFVAGAKEVQEYEKIVRQLNTIVGQFPQEAERVQRVLDSVNAKFLGASAAADKMISASKVMIAGMSGIGQVADKMVTQLVSVGTAANKMTAAMSENTMASKAMVTGMSAVGQAADKMANSVKLAAEAAVASKQMLAGMSAIGAAALESSVATQKMAEGMTAAGKAAAAFVNNTVGLIAGMTSVGAAALQSSVATQKMTEGMTAAGKAAAAFINNTVGLIAGMSQIGSVALESSKATEKLTVGMTAAGRAASEATTHIASFGSATANIAEGMTRFGASALANSQANDKLKAGLSAAGQAATSFTVTTKDLVAGMTSVGSAALTSSEATQKLTAGMSAAGKAAAEATAHVGSFGSATANIAAGMSKIGSAALESSVATEKLTAGLSRAGKDAAVPKQLDRIAQGMTDATNASKNMISGMTAVGVQAAKSAKTTSSFGDATKGARYELLNLSRQLTDVGVGLQSGQGLFTILVQQGSQIADIFATSAASGRSFGRALLDLITPTRLLFAGVTVLIGAFTLLTKIWLDSEKQLFALSERVDISTQKLRELQLAAEFKGISQDEFVKGMESFGDQVNLAKKGLGDLAQLMRANGKSAGGLEDSFLKVADLVNNAATGVDKFRILQAAGIKPTAEWVRLLGQGSDKLRDAIREAQGFGTTADDEMVKKAREFTDAWDKAWASFKVSAFAAIRDALKFLGSLLDKAGDVVKGIFGSSRTRGDELDEEARRKAAGIGSGGPLKISVPGPKTELPEDILKRNALERQHINLLGELASEQEKVRLKELDINDAVLNGVNLRKGEKEAMMEVARLTEIARRSQNQVTALGDAATAAEKYAAQVDALNVKLKDTSISQSTYNRALINLNPNVQAVKGAFVDLGEAMSQAFIQGADAAQALDAALKSIIAKQAGTIINELANQAIKLVAGGATNVATPVAGATSAATILTAAGTSVAASLVSGATTAASILGLEVPAAAATLPVAGAAAGTEVATGGAVGGAALAEGGVAAGAAILGPLAIIGAAVAALGAASFFGGSSDKDKATKDQAAAAMDSANDALKDVTKSFYEFTRVADGAVTSTIKNARQQFEQLKTSAESSRAAATAVVNTPGNTPAVMAQANANIAAANQAVLDATQQLADFNMRTIKDALDNFVEIDVSPVAQSIKDLTDKAKDLEQAMVETGTSAEEAAIAVGEKLGTALDQLKRQITDDLVRAIYELSGQDFFNQMGDLAKKIKDAQLANVDPNTIARFFELSAQEIVDSAKLTGEAFDELVMRFPELNGVVHEFTEEMIITADGTKIAASDLKDAQKELEEMQRALDELNTRALALNDRLFAANLELFDTVNTLEGKLAAFDRKAQQERSEEAARGGGNLALLEQTLAAERAVIIKKNHDEELAEQQRLHDAELAEQKRVYDSIRDYLKSLQFGALSALSPRQQFEAAQREFNKQLAQAIAGNKDALDNITKAADQYLQQARSFLGPSEAFASISSTVQQQLSGLVGGGQMGGIVGRFLEGGMVSNGIWNKDSVMARLAGGGNIALAGGEMITRAPSVNRATIPMLHAINQTGRVPANDDTVRELRAVRNSIESLIRVSAAGNDHIRDVASQTRGLRTDVTLKASEEKLRKKA